MGTNLGQIRINPRSSGSAFGKLCFFFFFSTIRFLQRCSAKRTAPLFLHGEAPRADGQTQKQQLLDKVRSKQHFTPGSFSIKKHRRVALVLRTSRSELWPQMTNVSDIHRTCPLEGTVRLCKDKPVAVASGMRWFLSAHCFERMTHWPAVPYSPGLNSEPTLHTSVSPSIHAVPVRV